MFTFFEHLTILESVYWAAAIIGGLLFVVRLLLMLFGGVVDADLGGGDLGDVHVGEVGHAGDGSDASFKLLSFQGVAAFFMMFGLAGLTLLSTELNQALVILGSLLVGVFAMWVVSQLYRLAFRLQSEGTVDIRNAVGQTGRVYLRIPADGEGQVQVSVQGSLREFNAVSSDHTAIPSGEFVVIESVLDQRTLVVRLKAKNPEEKEM